MIKQILHLLAPQCIVTVSIGKCYLNVNDFPNALYYFLEGYQYYPKRIENLYQIIHYYRNHGKNKLAYQYYLFAKRVLEKNPMSTDYLFLENDVYEYKLDYEFSIIGYYENPEMISMKNHSMKPSQKQQQQVQTYDKT